jgi:hypothetical protein
MDDAFTPDGEGEALPKRWSIPILTEKSAGDWGQTGLVGSSLTGLTQSADRMEDGAISAQSREFLTPVVAQ